MPSVPAIPGLDSIQAGINPSAHISRQVASQTDYEAQLAQYQAQLDALPMNGGFFTAVRRAELQNKIANIQKQMLQFDPNYGITPPATPAPVLGQRQTAPKVGIDALKILLPTS